MGELDTDTAQDSSWKAIGKLTLTGFKQDKASQTGAALAYYIVFALPALLVLLIMILGNIYSSDQAQAELMKQLEAFGGEAGLSAIQSILGHINQPDGSSVLTAAVGIAILIFSATGAFLQFQDALNAVWGVQLKPDVGLKKMLISRLLSFGLILGMAALVLLSVIVEFCVALFKEFLNTYFDSGLILPLFQSLNFLISLALLSLVFGSLFKLMPDVRVAWKDVLIGGTVTALLFTLGKWIMSIYLSFSDPGSAYGAAGSIMVLFFWVFLSMQLILLGAEFTWAYARTRGQGIQPTPQSEWRPGYSDTP